MDRNTIIGFVLIGIVLFAFSWLNQSSPEQIEAQRRYQDSIAVAEQARQAETSQAVGKNHPMDAGTLAGLDSTRREQLEKTYGVFAPAMTGDETFVTIENDRLELRLSTKGGRVSYARLKEYVRHDGNPLVLFQGTESAFNFTLITADNRVVNTADLYFTPIPGSQPNSLTMRVHAGGGYLDFIYRLEENDYILACSILGTGLNGVLAPNTNALDLHWKQDIRQQEKGRKFEDRYTALHYKYMSDDADHLSESGNDSKQIPDRLKWIGYKDMFFSTVLIAQDGFQSTVLTSETRNDSAYLKSYTTETSFTFDLLGREASDLKFFFVPNQYALLKGYDKDVDADQRLDLYRMISLGASVFRWVNMYFVIPLFDFLGRHLSNYGLIIFLLTVIVKLVLFPLTYKSYISSAKMRVLRPQVEEINARYPGKDKAMERQKATMELYSRAGASPMSGCIPMLLQMPILIALFMFFPSAIELRHEGFLWAKDLSTYDAIISWSTNIPIITPYFGNHISLFCLLMAITNIISTKYNMDSTNTGQQQMPGMKAMMYMMPMMFLVFFNQYASGLTYYYFISTLITVLQTIVFRLVINEDKLLAKLEENKKKPVKKSGFMKRLEEAQRLQQEELKKQQQKRKK